MKFLVTGGGGFIGQPLVRLLLRRGIATVAADRSPEPGLVAEFEAEAKANNTTYHLVSIDVSDYREVMETFRRHPDITHVVHLAYVMGPLVDENTSLSTRVNVLGMTHLFEAAVHMKVKRLIFTSSETVYGPSQAPYGDRPVTEDDFCDPGSHTFTYAVMKLLNEHMARRYIERLGADIVCVRPAVVFGHERKRSAVMWAEHFASKPATGEPVKLPFPASTRETWIYKDDCAEQIIRLALKEKLGHRIYNNGGTCASGEQLAAAVKKWLPDARIEFTPDGPGTPLIDWQCGKRLEQEIDFTPRSLEDGVRAHINEARRAAGLPEV